MKLSERINVYEKPSTNDATKFIVCHSQPRHLLLEHHFGASTVRPYRMRRTNAVKFSLNALHLQDRLRHRMVAWFHRLEF
jgi:hypothetical protein